MQLLKIIFLKELSKTRPRRYEFISLKTSLCKYTDKQNNDSSLENYKPFSFFKTKNTVKGVPDTFLDNNCFLI